MLLSVCKTSPTHFLFVQADRDRCFPGKNNADLEKYNRDVFGVTSDDELVHQVWNGQVWSPGLDQWEVLGSGLKAF